MLTNSCLFSIPVEMDKKLIFNLDGIRATLQIINLSYKRLCQSLEYLSLQNNNMDFTHVSLDGWAFIDSLDRLRGLWNNLDNILDFKKEYSKLNVEKRLLEVRNIRNVISHLPQRIDSLIAKNSSAMGEIGWIFLVDKELPSAKTYYIRYGTFYKNVSFKLTLPQTDLTFNQNNIGLIEFKVGEYVTELTKLYDFVNELHSELERTLLPKFSAFKKSSVCPPNIFGSAELNTTNWITSS